MWLTLESVLDELAVSRSTFDRWRATGRAPLCRTLPNGKVRVHRHDLHPWPPALPMDCSA